MLTVFVATFVIFALVISGNVAWLSDQAQKYSGQLRRDLIAGYGKGLRLSRALRCAQKTPGSRSAAQAGSHPINSRPHRAAFFDLPGFRFRRRVYHYAVGAKLACGTKIIGTINAEEDNMGFAL